MLMDDRFNKGFQHYCQKKTLKKIKKLKKKNFRSHRFILYPERRRKKIENSVDKLGKRAVPRPGGWGGSTIPLSAGPSTTMPSFFFNFLL